MFYFHVMYLGTRNVVGVSCASKTHVPLRAWHVRPFGQDVLLAPNIKYVACVCHVRFVLNRFLMYYSTPQ